MANHFDAELISIVFLGVLWVYSRESNMVHTLRNRIFQGTFLAILLSTVVNLVFLFHSAHAGSSDPVVLLAMRNLHNAVTPLSTLLCTLYTLAYIAEETGKSPHRGIKIILGSYGVYLGIVVTNPFTRLLFGVTAGGELTKGPLFPVTYGIFLLYCGTMYFVVHRNRNLVQPDLRKILSVFPTGILGFALFQQIFPWFPFGDIVSVCGLMTAYLYLQNKRICEDQLTGLPNRVAYLKMLDFLIRKKNAVIVMGISLNDFKFINDKYGQANGDLFLKEITAFLKQVVPTNGVFRVGGDKFSVIFEGPRLEAAGLDICRISDRFAQGWVVPNCRCHIGAAIGVAHYPASADNCGDLVSMLESALERAKKTASSQPVFCDRDMIERVRRRHELYETLCAALKEESMEVYYQPLYSIRKDQFTEAEALVRLRGEDGKFISPEEFIPIAEETGLIVDIGYLVLKQVCESIRSLLQQGVEIETVSVNLSVVQLMKPDFVPRVLQIIHGSGISPNRIILEITESILVSNYALITEKIKELSAEGIRFALDDFGTGYSNLTQVIDLPFHVVKIDRSLIWDAMNNKRCYIMVQNLANTFKSINLMVTAEGVETLEHDRFVRFCGCDKIQGFRYARPLPWAEAAKYMGESPEEMK